MRSGPLSDEEIDLIIEKHLSTSFDGTVREVSFKIDGFTQSQYGVLSDPDGNRVKQEFYDTLTLTVPEVGIDSKPIGPVMTSAFCGGEEIQFKLTEYEIAALGHRLNPFTDDYDVFIEADFSRPTLVGRGGTMDGYIGADKEELKKAIKAGFKATCDPYGDLELSIGGVKLSSGPVTLKRKYRKHRLNEHIDCSSSYFCAGIKRRKKNRRVCIKES